MNLEKMFKKNYTSLGRGADSRTETKPEVPEGLLKKCNKCGKAIIAREAEENYYICPKCGGYFRIPAYKRIDLLADPGSFEEWDATLETKNPLEFPGYPEKLAALKKKTGLREAVVTGCIKIEGKPVAIAVCDGRFLMASMGWAVGEKITRLAERATEQELPIILFTCSGGARMQEGMTSLMQMAKTSAALKRHSDKGLLCVDVLTDPTTGGVTASFAMLGDLIFAEPKALVGFAGPRVIEQTIGQKLPKGFQRSEFLIEHGFADGIIERGQMRETLAKILALHDCGNQRMISASEKQIPAAQGKTGRSGGLRELTAWERVQLSRKAGRPSGSSYIRELFTEFVELHGDRCGGDDKAVIGGIARFHGMAVTVIAQTKGSTTKENIERNFGMPSPEGYRKALRLMKQAEKFHRPVICFVDTPGAFCGLEAEERGQGEAIARNLYELSALQVPVLSVVVGEGGSGGALALAVADEVWILENAVYSILSPEGFASILWKDSARAQEAAKVMKMTSGDLLEQGIVSQVIPEPEEFTESTMAPVTELLDRKIAEFLAHYGSVDAGKLVEDRFRRFRGM